MMNHRRVVTGTRLLEYTISDSPNNLQTSTNTINTRRDNEFIIGYSIPGHANQAALERLTETSAKHLKALNIEDVAQLKDIHINKVIADMYVQRLGSFHQNTCRNIVHIHA